MAKKECSLNYHYTQRKTVILYSFKPKVNMVKMKCSMCEREFNISENWLNPYMCPRCMDINEVWDCYFLPGNYLYEEVSRYVRELHNEDWVNDQMDSSFHRGKCALGIRIIRPLFKGNMD